MQAIGGATGQLSFDFGVQVLNLAVMLGVEFAGFVGMVHSIGGVAGCDMSVVARRLDVSGLMMQGRFAMMLGGLLMVVGGVFVMFLNVMGRRHRATFLSWR